MAVWSNINYSEVQGFNRTDAEFYKPEYQEYFERVKLHDAEKISHFAYITDGIHASPDIMKDGIRYISAKCVKDNEFVVDDCIHISNKQNEQNPRTQLSAGDVIITTVGTIGNVAVVEPHLTPCNCDRHVGIIRIADYNNVSPYYLSTFLNTKYGKFQSLRESAGNVQLNLYIRNIGHIIVPRFGKYEEEIASCTKQAYRLRIESKTLYAQAQQLLESELGLDQLDFKKPVGYTARFSELEQSRRADAEFFQPKYQSIIGLIREKPYSMLRGLFHISRGICMNPNEYDDTDGVPYIRIKELSLSEPLEPENSVKIPFRFVSDKFPTAVRGDYILAVIGATIGKINLINETMVGALYSNNTACLSPKSQLDWPNAMELILRSPIVQYQVQQRMAKTAQEKITDPELKRILIPQLDSGLMLVLEELCLDSNRNYFESKQLLDQAKTRVEKLIEEAAP